MHWKYTVDTLWMKYCRDSVSRCRAPAASLSSLSVMKHEVMRSPTLQICRLRVCRCIRRDTFGCGKDVPPHQMVFWNAVRQVLQIKAELHVLTMCHFCCCCRYWPVSQKTGFNWKTLYQAQNYGCPMVYHTCIVSIKTSNPYCQVRIESLCYGLSFNRCWQTLYVWVDIILSILEANSGPKRRVNVKYELA